MRNYLTNQKGYSLLITVFTLLLISILGMSATAVALNSMKISGKERVTQATYYIAEAGLVEKKVEFTSLVDKAYEQTILDQAAFYANNTTQFDFETELKNNVNSLILATSGFLNSETTSNYKDNMGEQSLAKVKVVEKSPIPNLEYTIISTGEIGNQTKTTVYQDYKIGLVAPIDGSKTITTITAGGITNMTPPPKDVYALGKVTAQGNLKLNTTIHSSKADPADDKVHSKFKDKVVYGDEFDFELPPFPDTTKPATVESKPLTSSKLTLTEDVKLTSLPSGKITIDVGSEDKAIYLDATVYAGKQIEIVGTGKVSIFISNENQNEVTINPNITYGGTADKLEVYVDKGVKLGSSLNVDGSLYAADSGFTTQGDSTVRGTLYLGGENSDVKITGNGDVLGSIFAPNSIVEIKGTPIINGSIVSNDVVLGGNMTLNTGTGTVPGISVPGTTTTIVKEILGSDAKYEESKLKEK